MGLRVISVLLFTLFLLLSLSCSTNAAGLLEDGEDFSNNLVSDLAPLLALFGERVTTQFMSQSTGWADCIALAMAPIGVITIIVSAIRVAGPPILRAVIGRARENIATVELEVMSSTSPEVSELWNSQTRAVVRCPGTCNNCEFVCIYPKSMLSGKIPREKLKVQVMRIDEAVAGIDQELSPNNGRHYLYKVNSIRHTIKDVSSKLDPHTIVITRDPTKISPNITLNCTADGDHWQVQACAVIGIILQTGVLLFFGFLTKYRTLKFDKDGSPVEDYAMPMAVIGTVAVNLGILICAYVVDEGSRETVYEAIDKKTTAVATVWLQKEKSVSDQHFDSAAIYPTVVRHQACTSQRTEEKDLFQFSVMGKTLFSNVVFLELLATSGTVISLLGFFVQFIGLRGMHWLASIVQLGGVVVMTVLRAIIRRHLSQGLSSVDLRILTGFELEWFIVSLLDSDRIKWIPGNSEERSEGGISDGQVPSDDEKLQNRVSQFKWRVQTGPSKAPDHFQLADKDIAISPNSSFQTVSDLSNPQSVLDLRRHLGELSGWHGPSSKEALSVAQAIEKTMNFFMPYYGASKDSGLSLLDSESVPEAKPSDTSEERDARETQDETPKALKWIVGVDFEMNPQSQEDGGDDNLKRIGITITHSDSDGWSIPVDKIDSLLALWLLSTKEHCIPNTGDRTYPCGNDHWMRGGLLQEDNGLRILGPPDRLLLRDLEWWMPDGLNGILDAEMGQSPQCFQEFPHRVPTERIGHSGERWPNITTTFPAESGLKMNDESISCWKWKPLERSRFINTEEEQQNPRSRLIVTSDNPLHIHQAKDLFSSFLWSLANSLGLSAVSRSLQARMSPSHSGGPGAWREFTLENQQLSQLIRSIADLGLWTEKELWTSFIPPLSATDNLPGLEIVLQMVQDNGAKLERQLAWDQAGASYRWLFDIGSLSPPLSHIFVKSTAILWRFNQRLPTTDSPLYHDQMDLLNREKSATIERLEKQDRCRLKVVAALQSFFRIHEELESLSCNMETELESLRSKLYYVLPHNIRTRTVFEMSQSSGDIFDRTELHHVIQSTFIDHKLLHCEEPRLSVRLREESLKEMFSDYIQRVSKSVDLVRRIPLHPMEIRHDLQSAIFFPQQTFFRLLREGCNLDSRDLDHLTPLHYACQNGPSGAIRPESYYGKREWMILEALLLNKADINAPDLRGNTPLHLAVQCDRRMVVYILIEAHCNTQVSNLEGTTPLHLAAVLDDTSILYRLLEAGVVTDIQDKAGQTPLHRAIDSNNSEAAQILLNHGAKHDIKDKSGRSPVLIAAEMDILSIFDNHCDQDALASSILDAAEYRTIEAITRLMEKMKPSSWPPLDILSRSPFHLAIINRSTKSQLVADMIKKANDLEFNPEGILEPKNGTSPLHLAVKCGKIDSVKGIMENVNPNIHELLLDQADEDGRTPLFMSAKERMFEIFTYLAEQGANMRVRAHDGRNLLHAAQEFPTLKAPEFFTNKIENRLGLPTIKDMLEERDGNNRTPREAAKHDNNWKVVEFLDGLIGKLGV